LFLIIANWLYKFHQVVLNANYFHEQMDIEMSQDEMRAIFRDIKVTHEIFG